MSDQTDQLADPDLKALGVQIHEQLELWAAEMRTSNFGAAAAIAIRAIQELGTNGMPESGVCARFRRFARIMMNGLRDVANLNTVLADGRWIEVPNAIEDAWLLAHDARDRLACVEVNIELRQDCAAAWEAVIAAVDEKLGPGVYTSWGMSNKNLLCSICGEDIRACDHIPGRAYDNQDCTMSPSGEMQIFHVALTQTPRDPRCRFWPWRRHPDSGDGHSVYGVCIWADTNLHGDDDGGEVIDLETFLAPRKMDDADWEDKKDKGLNDEVEV